MAGVEKINLKEKKYYKSIIMDVNLIRK